MVFFFKTVLSLQERYETSITALRDFRKLFSSPSMQLRKKKLCSPLQAKMFTATHTKRINPTCSSNNTTKTLSGGPAGRVNHPFLRVYKYSGLQPAAPKFFFRSYPFGSTNMLQLIQLLHRAWQQ
jgi:hypothetical protein